MLQGFYQSRQATAAAAQVNNIHLVRGMLGKPGCGVLQMNGQPTAENTRECGADGDLPGFRNWSNDAHIAELADLWNLEPLQIPHYAPPTHCMQMFRFAEQGTLRMLWVTATNPVVSLPELARVRDILSQELLFLIVEDIFMTETAALADVVLPAAAWGEKTGTFTNADRTVHLSEKAIEPPGSARSDLDIFLDYARRMDFRDKDGNPFPPWTDPESAFEAWPCNEENPEGTERLYADGNFWAHPDYCEAFGKDLITGAPVEPTEYRAMNAYGKAIIKAAEYVPPHERPDPEYPFALITGRTVYQFHTRTKTARAQQLQDAAPDVWVEVSQGDAQRLAIEEGDLVDVITPRGRVTCAARICGVRDGVLFVPFHYGYWDTTGDDHCRAGNELTLTDWDPVSKQPIYKTGAAQLRKSQVDKAAGAFAAAPTTAASAPVNGAVPATVGGAAAGVAEVRPTRGQS